MTHDWEDFRLEALGNLVSVKAVPQIGAVSVNPCGAPLAKV
jgi:hypothetical protein